MCQLVSTVDEAVALLRQLSERNDVPKGSTFILFCEHMDTLKIKEALQMEQHESIFCDICLAVVDDIVALDDFSTIVGGIVVPGLNTGLYELLLSNIENKLLILSHTDDIIIGKKWYIKLPNKSRLDEVEIIGITNKTVALKSIFNDSVSRYKITDVEFVEEIEDSQKT